MKKIEQLTKSLSVAAKKKKTFRSRNFNAETEKLKIKHKKIIKKKKVRISEN